jgi:hypothetical protein
MLEFKMLFADTLILTESYGKAWEVLIEAEALLN